MAFKIDEIFSDVKTGLQNIRTANEWLTGKNYLTDIGEHLEDWETKPVPQEIDNEFILEDPVVEKKQEDEFTDHHTYFYLISVKAFQAKDENTIVELRKIRMDLFHCAGKLSTEFLEKYNDTIIEIPRCEIVVEETNRVVGGLIFNMRIQFTTDEPFMVDEI